MVGIRHLWDSKYFLALPPYLSVINGLTGILVENDVKSWIQAIQLLIENPDWREFIKKKAYEEIIKYYTIQQNAFKWLDFYYSILSKKQEKTFLSTTIDESIKIYSEKKIKKYK